ncbi:HAD hydrolase-like protein [Paenibacillus sp. GCM10028914]|uniref:HAD hydrolase-like protein n=1 Tax=Paenibacillus sp. GCM10028914 TaxID=3273416 RepID=UPI00361707DC
MKFEEVSFDIYQKYTVLCDFINSFRKNNESYRILEVGGRGSWLHQLLPNDTVYCLDTQHLEMENFILGDATKMDFENNSFDFVVSADVLEHIEGSKRQSFIKEHLRCAKIGALIIAPFKSELAKIEEGNIKNNYLKLSAGEEYKWLVEHEEFGLPDQEKIVDFLDLEHFQYEVNYFGWSPLWNFMLNISHHIVYFNWKYGEVYKKFNELNRYFNLELSQYDCSPIKEQNYRFAIKLYKNHQTYVSLSKNIYEAPVNIWSELSHKIWSVMTELSLNKDLEISQKNKEIFDFDNKVSDLVNSNYDMNIKYEALEKSFEKIQDEVDKLTSNLKLKERKINELTEGNKEIQEQLNERDEEIGELRTEIEYLKENKELLNAVISEKNKAIEQLNNRTLIYENSTSWRMTKPLRNVGTIMRKLKNYPKGTVIKAKKIVNYCVADKVKKLNDILRLNNIDNYTKISFDMFDTLVFRKVDPPENVHKLSAEFIHNLLLKEGILTYSVDEVLNIRYEEEWKLRNNQVQIGFDLECCFQELIYSYLVRINGESFAKKYKEEVERFEIETELAVLYANPEAAETLSQLKNLGKEIIVISDMYLENEVLIEILTKCGLIEFIDEVYVSNNFNLSKGSGRLFEKLLELKCIDKDRLLHVGDNYISDYKVPKNLGLNSIWYYSKINNKRRKEIRNSINSGNILRLAGKSNLSDSEKSNYYRLGFELLGPVYVGYIDELIRLMIKKKATDVFFLAREGYLFIKLYEKLRQSNKYLHNELPDGKYLYISRLTSSLPSVYRFGIREIRMGLWKVNPKGLASILSTFNLKLSEFIEYAKTYGFNHIEEPIYDPMNDIRLHNFIDDYRVQEVIEKEKNRQKNLLKKYLGQNGFFGKNKRAVFVDIGWSGTIQHNIGRAYIDDENFPELYGYYFGRNYDYHLRYIHHEKMIFEQGFSYDFESYKHSNYITEFPQLFEQSATAPHGSTIGYQEDPEGIIIPVLKNTGDDRLVEQTQNSVVSEIQRGILDFADMQVKVSNFSYIDHNQFKSNALNKLERFIKNPSRQEVQMFEQLNHSEDWGASKSIKLVNPKINLSTFLSKQKLKNELNAAFWKQGSLKLSGIPGIVKLYNFANSKRRS